MKSFVKAIEQIRFSALDYISQTISERGEVSVPYDENNGESELRVPCTDGFTGEMRNYNVKTIKQNSIIGVNDWGDESEYFADDWCDGTAEWIADYVAEHYGELE